MLFVLFLFQYQKTQKTPKIKHKKLILIDILEEKQKKNKTNKDEEGVGGGDEEEEQTNIYKNIPAIPPPFYEI